MTELELLAPARDAATAFAAIDHGADAVYIGGPAFGARLAACNSLDDIASVVSYAHRFGVRVYVTLNTIIYEHELEEMQRLTYELYRIGVDALIVQDMALLMPGTAPIELHASTQTDARTPEKAAMLARAGFAQIVLPREFSLDEIARTHAAAPEARLEVFVHGALCVSYSGDCQAGFATTGRSANRGECPQVCRLRFRLTDGRGRDVVPPDGGSSERHWLSLADMNRLDRLADLAAAGVTSFKIEGRLKSSAYVKEVTAAYSQALDRLIESNPGRFRRSSHGRVRLTFKPDTAAAFNRGFTTYFLTPDARTGISSTLTPKWTGQPVGSTLQCNGGRIRARLSAALNPGDGLVWLDGKGELHGFRVNKVEGDVIHTPAGADVPARPGIKLMRNNDARHQAMLQRDDTARRTMRLDMTLRLSADRRVVLDLKDERGCGVTLASDQRAEDTARTPQDAARRKVLERLGDTPYELGTLDDRAGDAFIPASQLAELRRRAIEALDGVWETVRPVARRKPAALSPGEFENMRLGYHDNVANSLARRFYESHGAVVEHQALEVEPQTAGPLRVMTTRYCLRRELGACLRRPEQASKLPPELFLEAPLGRFRLHFDCANCQMQIYK